MDVRFCKHCVVKRKQVCDHAPADRAPTDTWCTPELEMVLRKGYKLIFIHQVYHFKDQWCGLFKDYVDTWLKLKEEASGYPSDVLPVLNNVNTCNNRWVHTNLVSRP